jgi:pentatricopeptide repeat protein
MHSHVTQFSRAYAMIEEVSVHSHLLRMMAKQEGGCSPDVVSYTTVIHGFLNEGQLSTPSNLLHEMVEKGVVPNVVTYSSIIDGLCTRGRSKEARKILDCAVVKGLKPNIAAYSTMLHGYATEGCLVDMTNLYNLINAYAKCGSVDQAIVTFEDMERQGLPDAVTYSTMINAFYRKGRILGWMMLLKNSTR